MEKYDMSDDLINLNDACPLTMNRPEACQPTSDSPWRINT
jgi:hypothetical protein